MGKKLKKIEIFFLVLVVIIFSIVIGKYFIIKSLDLSGVIKTVKAEAQFLKYRSEAKRAGIAGMVSESAKKNQERAIPVLLYHGILESVVGEDISLKIFHDQMFALKKAGYQTVTIEQFYSFIKGEIDLPEKSFLLTFDDGRKASYYPVDPILKALNYHAIMYVITGHITNDKKSGYYLEEKELQSMVESGRWDLQSHGHYDHNPILIDSNGKIGRFIPNKQWLSDKNRLETDEEYETRVQNDFVEAKNELETRFGAHVVSFAFPFGDYGDTDELSKRIIGIAKSVYPFSFFQFRPEERTGFFRYNYPTLKDPGFLRRIKVFPDQSDEDMVNILDAGRPKELPYREEFLNHFNWIAGSTLGDLSFKSMDSITLKTQKGKSSSVVILDGSLGWKDYQLNVTAQLVQGKSYDLVVRDANGQNHASCRFEDNYMVLKEVVEGKQTILSHAETGFKLNAQIANDVGVFVKGNKMACVVNGKIIISSGLLNSSLSYGGIGFKIYDPAMNGDGQLLIKEVEVLPAL